MPKGFLGIKDITEQNSPEMWRMTVNGSDTKDAPKSQSSNSGSFFVDYDSSPSMPGLWQSQDNGTSWTCGNYIFVFQYRPCSESLVIQHVLNGEEPLGSLTEPLNSQWQYSYIWALFVYHKPRTDPKQLDDSIRWPILIITVEAMSVGYYNKLFEIYKQEILSNVDYLISKGILNPKHHSHLENILRHPELCLQDQDSYNIKGLERPTVRMFMPGGTHITMATLKELWGTNDYFIYPSPVRWPQNRELNESELGKLILEFFIEAACNHLKTPERPKKFGDMYTGFCAVYSDKLTPEAKNKVLNQSKFHRA